jgi:hypothetical protein
MRKNTMHISRFSAIDGERAREKLQPLAAPAVPQMIHPPVLDADAYHANFQDNASPALAEYTRPPNTPRTERIVSTILNNVTRIYEARRQSHQSQSTPEPSLCFGSGERPARAQHAENRNNPLIEWVRQRRFGPAQPEVGGSLRPVPLLRLPPVRNPSHASAAPAKPTPDSQ